MNIQETRLFLWNGYYVITKIHPLLHVETWKYQSEWEDAFTLKMYLFQFANYYGTIIYIAFFKGTYVFTFMSNIITGLLDVGSFYIFSLRIDYCLWHYLFMEDIK